LIHFAAFTAFVANAYAIFATSLFFAIELQDEKSLTDFEGNQGSHIVHFPQLHAMQR